MAGGKAAVPEVAFEGCAPVPLAAYLKALGSFRLVAEQKDKSARGYWRNEAFVLDTVLTKEELVRFFLEEYRPSPIISPWNGGSGFYYREGKSKEKDRRTGKRIKTGVRDEATAATKTLDVLEHAQADRFRPLRLTINRVRRALRDLGYEQAPSDEQKHGLVKLLRSSLCDDETLDWLDAALALGTDNLHKPPLLGTGGNDGNLDFSSNYMQRLTELFNTENGEILTGVRGSLESALFGTSNASLREGAIGQFAPGAAGGPNATTGFERQTLVNPWDYVLMLEGESLFSASATRRLQSASSTGLSYPFTVNSANTDGSGGALADEKRKSKGKIVGNSFEIWMPLWERAASLAEVRSLMSEGRATVGRRPARDGLDFVRAVASLGVNRGINSFERYALLQRRGDSISATPKGRIRVQPRPRARLLNDLDAGDWLSRFRQ
jgi:CRISPR-associated protein Csx17